MLSIVWVLIGLVYLTITKRDRLLFGRLWIFKPSVIWIATNTLKQGVGAIIIALTAQSEVLGGEYNQYIVTWRTIGTTSGWWALLTIFTVTSLLIVRWGSRANRSNESDMAGVFGCARLNITRARKDGLYWVCIAGIIFFMLESIVAYHSGSIDRGVDYLKWALADFRPTAIFIALNRLKMICLFLVPRNWKISNTLERCSYVTAIVLILGLSLVSGGRGAALYPGISLVIGSLFFNQSISRKKVVYSCLSCAICLGLLVPYLAAYRESREFQMSRVNNIASRASSLVSGVSQERFIYRVKALGRELYACSDGFLLAPHDMSVVGVGLSDLGGSSILRIVVPKIFSDRRIEKFDGSDVAQKAIGVEVKGWFPCISLPADLWRRGGLLAVSVGGFIMGIVLSMLDKGWQWLVLSKPSLWKSLLVLLPISLIQSNLSGGVRELVWQLCWDLPKYVSLFIALDLLTALGRKMLKADLSS